MSSPPRSPGISTPMVAEMIGLTLNQFMRRGNKAGGGLIRGALRGTRRGRGLGLGGGFRRRGGALRGAGAGLAPNTLRESLSAGAVTVITPTPASSRLGTCPPGSAGSGSSNPKSSGVSSSSPTSFSSSSSGGGSGEGTPGSGSAGIAPKFGRKPRPPPPETVASLLRRW